MNKGAYEERSYGKAEDLFLGIQVANGAFAEKGTHNMSQVSRDYHVTRSLLCAWIRLARSGSSGDLGFLTSNEKVKNGELRQYFEGGYITSNKEVVFNKRKARYDR